MTMPPYRHPSRSSEAREFRRRAITLIETLLILAVGGVILLALALRADSVRDELKQSQTRRCLQTLNQAIVAYRQTTEAWPYGPQTDSVVPAGRLPDPQALRVVAKLHGLAISREILNQLPDQLWIQEEDSGPALPCDAWGHSLRCLTADSLREADRQAVAARGGQPVFVSAGPDGDFGLDDPMAATDNIVLPPIGTTIQASPGP